MTTAQTARAYRITVQRGREKRRFIVEQAQLDALKETIEIGDETRITGTGDEPWIIVKKEPTEILLKIPEPGSKPNDFETTKTRPEHPG